MELIIQNVIEMVYEFTRKIELALMTFIKCHIHDIIINKQILITCCYFSTNSHILITSANVNNKHH